MLLVLLVSTLMGSRGESVTFHTFPFVLPLHVPVVTPDLFSTGNGHVPDPSDPGKARLHVWPAEKAKFPTASARFCEIRNPLYSPDGRRLVFEVWNRHRSPGVLFYWDLGKSDPQTFRLHGGASKIFSADGTLLAFQSGRQQLDVWDLAEEHLRLTLPSDEAVLALEFSPDNSKLAAVQRLKSSGCRVTVWDLGSALQVEKLKLTGEIVAQLHFSPNSRILGTRSHRLGSGKTSRLRLFEIATRTELAAMGLFCQDFDFSSDSQHVYVEGASSVQVRTVFGLDWLKSIRLPVNADIVGIENSGNGLLRVQSNHELGVFTPQVAEELGIRTGTVLLDLRSGRIVSHFPSAQDSAFSPDGRVLWTRDHRSQLWTTTLASADDSTGSSGLGWLPDFQVQNWGTGSPWARVYSPLTNRPVVYFKALNLDKSGQVEWLAWTANNDYTGSADWSKHASLVWRNGPPIKKPNRDAVRRALQNPAQLWGQATKPREYDLSVAKSTADTRAIAAHLDQVLENPGAWQQMCYKLSRVSTREFPTRGYDREWTTNYLSRENLERFRNQRLVSLQELSKRLQGVRTLESRALEIYLMITLDLNGVEILPTLLELESILEPSARYHPNPKEIPDSLLVFDPYKMSDHTQVLCVITAILNKEQIPQIEALGRQATYDAKTRGFVVGVAKEFLKSVKPEHYRGAQAMSTEPEVR